MPAMKNFADLNKVVDFILTRGLPKDVIEFGTEEDIELKYKWLTASFNYGVWSSLPLKAGKPLEFFSFTYSGVTFHFIDINKLP